MLLTNSVRMSERNKTNEIVLPIYSTRTLLECSDPNKKLSAGEEALLFH